MWVSFLNTGECFSNFRSVCKAHSITIFEAEAITAIFGLLHETNDLQNPEAVIEGRKIYDTLMNERQICRDLGLIEFEPESFWNERSGG